jgi:multidrug efflux pump subunit AcrA (membrane-fusion protein)
MTKQASMPRPRLLPRHSGFVILSSFVLLISSFSAAADLTTAIGIRTLPYERSLEKLPVELTAVVGFVESGGTVFVQDDTAGTHLHFKPARNDLRVGDRVRQGQLLARIDLTEADAALEQAQRADEKSRRDLARGERLQADEVMALEQLQNLVFQPIYRPN